jgi:hypothetical protein
MRRNRRIEARDIYYFRTVRAERITRYGYKEVSVN